MQRSHTTARLISAAVTLVATTVVAQVPVAAQGQGSQMTICHRTGSPSNPWVFMTIDARTWPEHQSQGDIQAGSLTDCAPPTEAPAVAPTSLTLPTAAATPTPQPSQRAVREQQIVPGLPIPEVPALQLRGGATPTAVAPTPSTPTSSTPTSSTPPATVEVAGVTADRAVDAPEISALPKSGGEPDRGLLVFGLIAVAGVGMLLRRLARRGL